METDLKWESNVFGRGQQSRRIGTKQLIVLLGDPKLYLERDPQIYNSRKKMVGLNIFKLNTSKIINSEY